MIFFVRMKPPRTPGQLLVSLYLWGVFLITLPVALLLGTAVFLGTFWFDPDRRWMHEFNCRWTFDYLRLNPFWQVSIEGRERLPRQACVLVSNHRSMADVVTLMGLNYPFKFVSKHSLFALPVVGWLMRLARYVELDRASRKSMQRMIEACRGWLDQGVSVLLFPEGTYSPDGKLLPFRRGAFALAIAAKVPVVPLAVEGTDELIHEDGPWFNPRCRIRVRVLEPVPVEELGEDPTALAARVRAELAHVLGQPLGAQPAVLASPESEG